MLLSLSVSSCNIESCYAYVSFYLPQFERFYLYSFIFITIFIRYVMFRVILYSQGRARQKIKARNPQGEKQVKILSSTF